MATILCGHTNHNKKVLVDRTNGTDLVILNDGTPTSPNQNYSEVGITLTSPDLACLSAWEIIPDCGMSDNFPIYIISKDYKTMIRKRELRYTCSKADQKIYAKAILKRVEKSKIIDY